MFEEYNDAKIVKCRTQLAVGFTVGKEYFVKEVRRVAVLTDREDIRLGIKGTYTRFTDIYMMNDNGNLVNAAEPTDFEIVEEW